ncbi:MAG: helix-turn-helix transcriptional regulator [Gammaproteobacteria bacterium]|nr:helix-turn-helix transcriptional regulator [Gammaproteobacteria bacterium]
MPANKNQIPCTDNLANARQPISEDVSGIGKGKKLKTKKVHGKKYHLGSEYHHSYLTKRELDCLYHLLRGQTAKGIGNALNLSRRTVEYYLDNIKGKLYCRTKSELIEKILSSNFLMDLQAIWQQR